MKWNFVLAAGAFCLAIGGIIASSLSVTDIVVHARLIASGAIQCINTGKQCESTGNQTCTVIVPTSKPGTGGSQTASTGGSFNTYSDAGCSIQLTNNTPNAVVSTKSVYELRPIIELDLNSKNQV